MRSSERLTVPIVLCRTSNRPMREQLIDALRRAIDDGLLPAGSQLPSTRTLAELLGVSRGVAVAAYEKLHADGTIHSTGGSGTYVSDRRQPPRPTVHMGATATPVDLRPGQACAEGFPLAAWRSAWRQASYLPPLPGRPPGHGLPELRTAITDHVRRVHGYAGTSHQVVITSGARHGLRVLLRAIAPRNGCALTDPGPTWLSNGLPVCRARIPLDEGGVRVDALPDDVDIAFLAPDGEAPLGIRTSAERRRQVAAWARRTGSWLITTGGDVTTNPLAPPLPSLLGPPRTAVLSDLGELLTPAVSIGYLLLPNEIADLAARQIASAGELPSPLCQRAAAELFRTGTVARRANQLAAVHGRKLAVIRDILGTVRDNGSPGTATVPLPPWTPLDRLIATARDAGLLLTPLRDCYAEPDTAPAGILLGFGQLPDAELRAAVTTLASAIRELGVRIDRVA